MFSIQGILICKSKLPDEYKHLCQIERYQIASLMKVQHSITQIASLIGRLKCTIRCELRRNAGSRNYRPKQVIELEIERSEQGHKAVKVTPWVKEQASALLRMQWSPEQVASRLPVSHETLYQHVYADKTPDGSPCEKPRCQEQKSKCYASVQERRGHFPNRRPLSARPAHIESRKQVGHWKCNTVIGANHKKAVVAVVERESRYAAMENPTRFKALFDSNYQTGKFLTSKTRIPVVGPDNWYSFSNCHGLVFSFGYFSAIKEQLIKNKFNPRKTASLFDFFS